MRIAGFIVAALLAAQSVALAQDSILPPANVPVLRDDGVIVVAQANAAELVQRLQRVEAQNRELTGQVEELQNRLRRLQDAFQKYQEDLEFRLQTLEGGTPAPRQRGDAGSPATNQRTTDTADAGPGEPPATLGTLPGNGARQTEDTAAAEGAPMLLEPGDPVPGDPAAPLDLTLQLGDQTASVDTQQGSTLAPPGLTGLDTPAQAPAGPASAKTDFDVAYGLLQNKDFEASELAFRQWLADHPEDTLMPDATHWLGESLFQRQQYREAAEQFLKVTTTWGQSRRAPSSLLRLGMSLAALGERDAACATFREVGRKYPEASNTVKTATRRASERARCAV